MLVNIVNFFVRKKVLLTDLLTYFILCHQYQSVVEQKICKFLIEIFLEGERVKI